jgi:hypothetical protein
MTTRFADVLGRIGERVDLPQPARTRFLLEIAADLEDLYRAHRDAGASPEDSRRRAIETLDLSDDALRELAGVHASRLRRALDQLSVTGRGRVERALQGGALLLVLLGAGTPLLRGGLLADAGRLAGPVLAIALVGAALFVRKAWALWIAQDHAPRRVRAGALPVLALAGIGLLAGAAGYGVDLFLTVARVTRSPDLVLPLFGAWLLRGSALLVVSFLCALAGGLLWFVLEGKIARVEAAEMSLRLESPTGSRRSP